MKRKSLLFLLATIYCIASKAETWTIEVANYQFSPSSLNVNVGDTVKWVWVDGSHTTTSTSIPAGADPWDSPIRSGKKEFSYRVTVAGIYQYWCVPHAPNMAGTIQASGILPVVLSSFKVLQDKAPGQALLQWSTTSEINTAWFIIKKSTDGLLFTECARVEAKGTVSGLTNYAVTDNNAGSVARYIYYEIEMKDKDGASAFSPIKVFTNTAASRKLITDLSPNPIARPGHLMFRFNAETQDKLLVQLFDTQGTLLNSVYMNAVPGLNNGHFHMGDLASGIYHIRFTIGNLSETYQVIMQ